jgi:DNA-binding response OmpR family regulator
MPRASAAMPKRILIIDDVPELRELTQSVLEDEGFVVDVAPDASLGGLKLLSDKPDLIILDLLMPGVDGFKFLEYVRQSTTARPIFILLSGSRTVEAALKGIALGAFAFLPKPVDFKKLVDTCRAALSRGSPEAPGGQGAAERRAHVRRAVLIQIRLLAPSAPKRAVIGEMTELSAGGATIISLAPLAVGTRVELVPDPRAFRTPRALIAEIRSQATVETGFRHGIQFVDLGPELEQLLKEHLGPAS